MSFVRGQTPELLEAAAAAAIAAPVVEYSVSDAVSGVAARTPLGRRATGEFGENYQFDLS